MNDVEVKKLLDARLKASEEAEKELADQEYHKEHESWESYID